MFDVTCANLMVKHFFHTIFLSEQAERSLCQTRYLPEFYQEDVAYIVVE